MHSLDLSIVIPTYCEADNLAQLGSRIKAAVEPMELAYELIVVDDDSPDSTSSICSDLANELPLRLIVRRGGRGLASAVLHGMAQARGRILLVMDADLSHPPEVIPLLVDAIRKQGADFALGSRYVAGGGTDADWGLARWLNSRIATWLAFPLSSVSDPMSGFFAISKSCFERAPRLAPRGYKIGLELLVKCQCQNVVEVPIQFRSRIHGHSKLTPKQQAEFLLHLSSLYRFRLGRRNAA